MRTSSIAWLLTRIIRAFLHSGRRKRKAKQAPASSLRVTPSGFKVDLPPDEEERFIAKMQAIAATSGGAVQVQVPAGRRNIPNQLGIVNLAQPANIWHGTAFISARATIDTVVYGFHAYPHMRATSESGHWLYYSVTGPERETRRPGEFQITDEFRWTGDRPLNPMLVKYALRRWVQTPEVQKAVELARGALPKPTKYVKPAPPPH